MANRNQTRNVGGYLANVNWTTVAVSALAAALAPVIYRRLAPYVSDTFNNVFGDIDAGELVDRATDTVKDVASKAASQVGINLDDVTSDVKSKAKNVADKAKNTADKSMNTVQH